MKKYFFTVIFVIMLVPLALSARLNDRQAAIVQIASRTAAGSLDSLYASLDKALDSTLTVNEAKEVMVHSYAYCGFPRALQSLKTLVRVLDDRKSRGVVDDFGREATPLDPHRDKYERGREILSEISGVPVDAPAADYAVLSPEVEVFLKEHLFSDLFERDVLSYADREVATVAVIASLGAGVEPMLAGHSNIAMRLGASQDDIDEIRRMADENRWDANRIFPKGDEIKSATFIK